MPEADLDLWDGGKSLVKTIVDFSTIAITASNDNDIVE